METMRICPNCRKPLPPDVPLGLCPECLIKSGFPTESGTGAPGEAAGARFVPPPVEEIAQLFPQLEILSLIGKGGMGAVYKARQPMLDRFIALKVLPPAVAGDPGFAERFNREARALARLNHQNIVAVYDFGKAGNLHYLLMEFVDGTNLRQVEQAGKLSSEQALTIVPKICEALQYAHDQGVVHRDIKPENILLDKSGRVKIADFGIAKMVGLGETDVSLTGAKDVVGTPHYMAPEQIEKPQEVDHRADIYSLGVVFYEMLTGELPLGKFAAPSTKVHVDVRLDEVVLHTLEKEPSRRYQHASQVKSDVETITGTAGLGGRAGAGQTNSDKAILPALLLAFPFGLFGAHRFYVGKIGTAFTQLGAFIGCILLIIGCATGAPQPITGLLLGFLAFGCFIWAIMDWILILCKAFTDGQGRRMTHWLHPQNGNLKTGTSPMTGPPSGPPPGGAAPPAGTSPPPPPIGPEKSTVAATGMIVAPAVGLMVVGLWKLLSALTAMMFLSGHAHGLESMLGQIDIGPFFGMADAGLVFFKVIPALLILFGAFQMLQLRSYAWSIAAGILSIVICSLIGLPIGIWALIVLARPDVKETFANAARSGLPRMNPWPWALGAVCVAGLAMIIALGVKLAGETPDVTVTGIVTDAATGQAIAGARVDDNRKGADANGEPAQVWTDTNGHYEFSTRYDEHTVAASAPGYEARLSTLRPKVFAFARNVSMNFRLQPEPRTTQSVAANVETNQTPPPAETAPQAAAVAAVTATPPPAATVPVFQPIRIKAGTFKPLVDHDGNLWLPDQGFADGDTVERPYVAIANTRDPELYRSERYGMTSFSYPVPNGKYVVKLHFAETYEDITGPGKRVFTYIVEGHEFKDFDVWAEAGGAQRAFVQTVTVEVSDGRLDIYFIHQQQNPQINGIEILPSPAAAITPSSTDSNSGLTMDISSQNGRVVIATTNGTLSADKVQFATVKGQSTMTASKIDLKLSPVTLVPSAPPPPSAPSATANGEVPAPAKSAGILNQPSSHPEKTIGSLSTTDPYQQDFNRTLPLSARGRLRLDNVNGRIDIAGWNRNEVVIRALKHGRTQESVEATEIKVDASPDEISIHTREPVNKTGSSGFWSWFGIGGNDKANVDYAIQVPRHARLANVSSVNGRVEINNVDGDIEASTVNGQVQVQGAAGSVKLSTVNGGIETELVSLGGSQSVSLTTVNGAIKAILPVNADAEVTADTVNGGMSSDFPELVVKKDFPLAKHLKGTLGNGGATVKATTVNGSIHFQRGNVVL